MLMNKDFRFNLKCVFLCLRLSIKLISQRTFGNIIHDIGDKYDNITIPELRRYQKLKIKVDKAELDLKFLCNCELFNVYPKFINFRCSLVNIYKKEAVEICNS